MQARGVSLAWLHAVKTREIHNARVIFCTLESLLLSKYGAIGTSFSSLHLYSTRDGFYFKLPQLPRQPGISHYCECLMLDGKIYTFGEMHLDFCLSICWTWLGQGNGNSVRQKAYFRCAALDGKMYVLGNDFRRIPVLEVYDPKTDMWSLINPIPSR